MPKLKQGHASEMPMEAGRQWLHPGAGLWGTWVWKEGWMIEGCPCIWGLRGIFLEPRCNLPHEQVSWSSETHT